MAHQLNPSCRRQEATPSSPSKIPNLTSLKERQRNTKTTTLTLPSNKNNQPTLPSTQYPKRAFSWSASAVSRPLARVSSFLYVRATHRVSRARLLIRHPLVPSCQEPAALPTQALSEKPARGIFTLIGTRLGGDRREGGRSTTRLGYGFASGEKKSDRFC
jgi:hypothetical protein